MIKLYQIKNSYFTSGIETVNGVVATAAPSVYYMARDKWSIQRVVEYCLKKGWNIAEIKSRKEEV